MTIVPPWFRDDLVHFLRDPARSTHAVLLHGQAGIGKRHLATAIARGLLCESDDASARADGGCGLCAACGWFDQGNHPDFRKVVPEALALLEGLDLQDDADGGDDDPEPATGGSRSKRAPSREVKVDQVRALHGFLAVATHRNRFRVVLMYPLETLNDIAANALLKMLEEPPAATVFVLVADHLGRIPATILSRCNKLFVPTPATDVAAAWLAAQGVEEGDELLAAAGGAPLAALALSRDEPAKTARRELLQFLQRPGADAALAAAESFGRAPPAPLVHAVQQWLADCIAVRLSGRIRYHPAHSATIAALAGRARLDAMMKLMQRLDAVRCTIDHPLNARLLFESVLTAYADAVAPAANRTTADQPIRIDAR